MQSREKEYLDVAGGYNRAELGEISKGLGLLVNEMEDEPFSDRLGIYYLEHSSKSSKQSRGEFYTPDAISAMIAKMLFEEPPATDSVDSKSVETNVVIAANKPVSILEPCCGAGGMILNVGKEFSPVERGGERSYVDLLRVTAIDISVVACDMSYINTTLWGIPARVINGNFITGKINIGWKNIHWMRVGEDQRLNAERMLHIIRELEQEPEKEIKPEPQKPSNFVDDVDVQRNPEPPKRENYDQPELF